MADEIKVSVTGIDAMNKALANAAKSIRTRAVRLAFSKAGRVIRDAAKASAPVLARPAKNRKPGTLKAAIVVRPSKFARQDKNEGVFIGVRPLRGKRQTKLGKAGANNPNDPFYWRFQEFGWKNVPGKLFLSNAAASKGDAAVQEFMKSVIPQIERLNSKASA